MHWSCRQTRVVEKGSILATNGQELGLDRPCACVKKDSPVEIACNFFSTVAAYERTSVALFLSLSLAPSLCLFSSFSSLSLILLCFPSPLRPRPHSHPTYPGRLQLCPTFLHNHHIQPMQDPLASRSGSEGSAPDDEHERNFSSFGKSHAWPIERKHMLHLLQRHLDPVRDSRTSVSSQPRPFAC